MNVQESDRWEESVPVLLNTGAIPSRGHFRSARRSVLKVLERQPVLADKEV